MSIKIPYNTRGESVLATERNRLSILIMNIKNHYVDLPMDRMAPKSLSDPISSLVLPGLAILTLQSMLFNYYYCQTVMPIGTLATVIANTPRDPAENRPVQYSSVGELIPETYFKYQFIPRFNWG